MPLPSLHAPGLDSSVHLDSEDLLGRLRELDPGVVLVPRRIMRRVLTADAERGGAAAGGIWHVPHSHCWAIRGEIGLQIVTREELELPLEVPTPDWLFLLARPEPEELRALPVEQALRHFRRLLFHAKVHARLRDRIDTGRFTTADLRDRIELVGRPAFEEIRQVLREDDLLLPPYDDATTFIEFAAVWLELRSFHPERLDVTFPGLSDPETVAIQIERDVAAEELFRSTQLRGLPVDPPPQAIRQAVGLDALRVGEPIRDATWNPALTQDDLVAEPLREGGDQPVAAAASSSVEQPPPTRSLTRRLKAGRIRRRTRRQLRRAERQRDHGDLVRAALARMKAARFNEPDHSPQLQLPDREIDILAERLGHALKLDAETVETWREMIAALLVPASNGNGLTLTHEARLLHDLQKVCVDTERPLSRIDLLGWLKRWGRGPLKRDLPFQSEIQAHRHLRQAARRARLVKLDEANRSLLAGMIQTELSRLEQRLRDQVRPVLERVLREQGWHPTNLPEQAARNTIEEELLDRLVSHGFLSYGDLRDAVARNALKLDDATPWGAVLFRDRLLQTDHALGEELRGAYRPAEIYFRFLHRLSSLLFGNAVGRWLAWYVGLPFGGSYLLLAGLDHTVLEWIVNPLLYGPPPTAPDHTAAAGEPAGEPLGYDPHHHWGIHLGTPWLVLTLGLLFFGLIHSGRFRALAASTARVVGRGLRNLAIDLPRYLLTNPITRAILKSPTFLFSWRYLVKPLAICAVIWPLLPRGSEQAGLSLLAFVGGPLFLAVNFILNSKPGQDLQEIALDLTVQSVSFLIFEVVPGFVGFFVDLFKAITQAIEATLYQVDLWLRYRMGESQTTLGLKVVFGSAWASVHYLVRLIINLFVEPQLNPVKHFPVVTVSHKFLLPTIPILARLLIDQGWEEKAAYGTVTAIVGAIPGIFGFLAWELKENWRIYRANRPDRLRPRVIGTHGETLLRLIKPGFHSGTVPKIFRKLRRLENRDLYDPTATASPRLRARLRARLLRQRAALRHVEVELHHFVEREILHPLHLARPDGSIRPRLAEVRLAVNQVWLEFDPPRPTTPAPSDESASPITPRGPGRHHKLDHDHHHESWRHADISSPEIPTLARAGLRREHDHPDPCHGNLGTNQEEGRDSNNAAPSRLILRYVQFDGWLIGGIVQAGWLDDGRLEPEDRTALLAVLAGLHHLAGAHLVHDDLARHLAAQGIDPPTAFTVRRNRLRVWKPRATTAFTANGSLLVDPSQEWVEPLYQSPLRFDTTMPFFWNDWVVTWDRIRDHAPPVESVRRLIERVEPSRASSTRPHSMLSDGPVPMGSFTSD